MIQYIKQLEGTLLLMHEHAPVGLLSSEMPMSKLLYCLIVIFILTMCLSILCVSCRVFWQNTSPEIFKPLHSLPSFGFLRLLAFPKAKRLQLMDEIKENVMRQLMLILKGFCRKIFYEVKETAAMCEGRQAIFC